MKERFSPDCRTLLESDGTGGVAPARHWLSPSELGKGRKSVGHSVLSKGGEYGRPTPLHFGETDINDFILTFFG